MANVQNDDQNTNKNSEIVSNFSNIEESKKDNRSICCYARVSTQGQEKGLESQVRALRVYCKQNDIDNYLLFTDEGISGTKSSRPALDKMMTAVREGKISKVIVYSFSRYARSVTHLLSALQEFKELNTDFISVSERIDTNTPLGQAMFTVLSAISQLERDILVERVKIGLANAKAKGVKIGRKKTRDSSLIRRLYQSGATYKTISKLTGSSNGSISAEVRDLKKELKDKEQLDSAMQKREYETVKDELEKTRRKMQQLEEKLPPEKRMKKSSVSFYQEPETVEDPRGEPEVVSAKQEDDVDVEGSPSSDE